MLHSYTLTSKYRELLKSLCYSMMCNGRVVNLLSPKNDQHQCSPYISTKVKWKSYKNNIVKRNTSFDLLSNSFDEFFKEMYGEQFGEFVSGYWGFKS